MAKLSITIEDDVSGKVVVELRSDDDLMTTDPTQAQELGLLAMEMISVVIDSSDEAVMMQDYSGQLH